MAELLVLQKVLISGAITYGAAVVVVPLVIIGVLYLIFG